MLSSLQLQFQIEIYSLGKNIQFGGQVQIHNNTTVHVWTIRVPNFVASTVEWKARRLQHIQGDVCTLILS